MKRILSFDIAKCLCTLWIVGVWHLYGYSSTSLMDNIFGQSVTVVVLSCFMFISGLLSQKYFFNDKMECLKFYKKKALRFWILLLISCASLHFAGVIIGKTWFSDSLQLLLCMLGFSSFFPPIPGTVWFMSMLMLFYELTPIVKRNNYKNTLISGGIIYCLFIIVQLCGHPIDRGLFVYFPFYLVGLIFPFRIIQDYQNKRLMPLLLIVLAFCIILIFPESTSFLTVVKHLLVSIIGIGIILSISYKLEKHINKIGLRIVNFISYSSLCLYLFHRHVYQLILFLCKIVNVYPNYVIMLCFMLPVAIVMSFYVQKYYDLLLNKIIKV